MTKHRFNIFVGLTLILGLLLSCNNKPKNGRTDTYSSGSVSFASDESFSPIIEEQLDIFESMYPEAKVKPIYTNELDAVNMLMTEKVWLAITTRAFTPKEKKNLQDRKFMPRAIPLAYDGLALIVNNANPDTCISVKDIKRILGGEVKNWKDVFPTSKLGEFDVVFDNAKSSTVHYCADSILGGKPINSPNITAVKKSEEVVNYVSKHENALGVIGSNWLNDKRDTTNVTFNKNIRVVSVSRLDKATPMNSWKPYQYYIFNGNYPLVRTIYALLNDPRNGLPWGFSSFMQSPKGQLIFFKAGLLPVRGELNIREVNVSND
ncbi:MAG: substrate-binding domain-containing protein [Prevotellaceae bacterium]|nr:substrate-binding domain-containing protein [Prevotellaceae bacterium]